MSADRQRKLRANIEVLKTQIADPTMSHVKATKQGDLIRCEQELDQLVRAASEIPQELVAAATETPIPAAFVAAINAPTPPVAPSCIETAAALEPTPDEPETVATVAPIQVESSSESLQSLLS